MVDRASITALLGPTNTGKTHRAVERMLEHRTGMIGLPLRLLAREIYDKVSGRLGENRVALVTGEEKRIPPEPDYWVCTVEAMPSDRAVDFLAVDEIQLAAHPERGHVFTDRLLASRGRSETWFLGSHTMRPLMETVLPALEVRRHPRLSKLVHTGAVSLGQLPPRSVVVAFSMARVYEIAERLRRRRGGAAVVLGALSPRARNAQVAMYQAREVDHMVATDAIGMGLNLDLDHVAFADTVKFDGREARELEPAEIGQIAGRAGRYTNDGSFGTLAPLSPFSPKIARTVEGHAFHPERRLFWRNSDLDFTSIDALVASLRTASDKPYFRSIDRADDFSALASLAQIPEIRARAAGSDGVRLLWEACQIPDYRQLLPEAHARLCGDVFLQLSGPSGRVDFDWLAAQIARLDDPSGDIDTLLMRMASIRTFTYVSSHTLWVERAPELHAAARAIEDRLSDALHARLVERFVDRTRPMKHRSRAAEPALSGNPFAKLRELLPAEPAAIGAAEADAVWNELADAPHDRFRVDARGRIFAGDVELGQLVAGSDRLHPEVRVVANDAIGAGARARLGRRLRAFSRDLVAEIFAPLRGPRAKELGAAARGLVYQLERELGTVLVRSAEEQIVALDEKDRELLKALGVEVGRLVVHLPDLLRQGAIERRAALYNVHADTRIEPPPRGAVSLRVDAPTAKLRAGMAAIGYPVFGGRALRADLAERAAARIAAGPIDESALAELSRWLGCPRSELGPVLGALGASEPTRERRRRRSRPRRPRRAAGSA